MATTYLHRTPGSPGNRRTWTVSAWVKFAAIGDKMMIFTGGTSGSDETVIALDDACTLRCYQWTGSYDWHYETSRLLRDPSAWYHIVVAADTTNAVADDRIKIYINGTRYTGPWDSEVVPSLNQDTNIMDSDPQKIGNRPTDANYFNGVMAHVHLIDGTQYAASDFGETDATSGIWVPKTGPSVTYGTQGGFYKFASGALGTDSSGNGNTMTVSGTMTNTKDTPDNNFCLPNDLSKGSTVALSNGNTTIAKDSGWLSCMGNFGMDTGKWYWEQKVAAVGNANAGITMSKQDGTSHSSVDATRIMYGSDGNVYNEQGSTTATGTTFTTGDIISVALDCAGDTIKFYNNDVLIHTETETDISDNEWCPAWGMSSGTWDTNFGNGYFATTAVTSAVADGNGEGQFEYAPPSGYLALCTNNLGSDS